MKINFLEFRKIISDNIFTLKDVYKHFNKRNELYLRQKISRYVKKRLVFKIKKGFYCFEKDKVDLFQLANLLYQPSYISCQSALFYYGVIPDVPHSITCVNPTTTKTIRTDLGEFIYYKLKKELFFGYQVLKNNHSFFKIAHLEKAILDYLYLNKLTSTEELRLDLSRINWKRYEEYKQFFPTWIKKINLKI